jgi:hypothetical protein
MPLQTACLGALGGYQHGQSSYGITGTPVKDLPVGCFVGAVTMVLSDPVEQALKLQKAGKGGSSSGSTTEIVAKNGGWGRMVARTSTGS